MTSFAERTSVQSPLVRYSSDIGWRNLSRHAALTERGGESGTLLYKTLERKLLDLNPGVVTTENVREVIERIESARVGIEGNFEILRWLRGEQTVKVASEKRTRNVTLVDFEHIENNVFNVTEEWEYANGRHTNRADVMFVINGVPVAIVETKHAKKADAIDRGLKQIREYHDETPEMLTAPQVFDLTRVVEFYYGVTWSLDRKSVFNWKDEEPGNFERKVKRFFGRERFLRMLRDWIIFYRKDDELRKIVLRQHQTRAVEKAVARSLDPAKSRGLVWHTQGSGKTFTMISTAEQLLDHPSLRNEKPTILMIVDRTELEQQLFQNLAAYGLPAVVARSKRRLRALLRSDYRGLIVSMIHKFDGADANLSTSENIFVLIDEAHRSTGGTLGNYLVAALPKATIIGFTGTPIDRTAYGEGTFKIFGRDDERGYLDKYSIRESIEDGTTLELNYSLARSELRVPPEILEREFLALKEAEGISDIEELNTILERAVRTKEFLKADNRVAEVAKAIAQHFKENVEPLGYKAFIVAVDREACVLYKHALDEHLPAEYSAVVISANPEKDDEGVRRYWLSEDDEKKLRKAFIRAEGKPFTAGGQTYESGQPKILIVTEKLLTGFDAPILYCMYFDKPMRDHTLLQAIARVNRPYAEAGDEDKAKPAGLVVDFVGIFDKLEKALAFDDDDVASVIKNIDVLKDRFAALLAGQGSTYRHHVQPPYDDKAVERVIEAFEDKGEREEFYRFIKEIETLYDIISPDEFLRPLLDDYLDLTRLHALVRGTFGSGVPLLEDVRKKTAALVREHAVLDGLTGVLEPVRLDEEALAALKSKQGSSKAQVINLGRTIISTIKDGPAQPYLLEIQDRAKDVLERLDDRQTETQQALAELETIVREYQEIGKERERLNLDETTFAFFQTLKQAGLEPVGAQELATVVSALFERYPEQRDNAGQKRALKAELYKELLPKIGKEKMVKIADRLLDEEE
jgi:type I site-specific deoxyribonuclease, HsdR family